MENASKAILIAGGILISIILISLLVNTYGNIGKFKSQEITGKEIQQIEEENKEYTKYLGKTVYGTEVITVQNMAKNSKKLVNVVIQSLSGGNIPTLELKTKAFKCDNIKYDNSTGRVNYIHFKELKIQENP